MPTPAIHTDALSHTYPGAARRALDGISICVAPGEVFGVLGPNGGGKTTLFSILATRLQPTAGSASIFGHDPRNEPQAVRAAIGVVFQSPSLDGKLTALENLVCHAGLFGIHKRDATSEATEQLKRLGLGDRLHDRVEAFSGGMRRRVEIAKALIHRPPLLLMDEPSTGLDPRAQRQMWDLLHELRDATGLTIALTTHLMTEAERCDRLAILADGRMIALDTPDALRARIGGDVVMLQPTPESEDPATLDRFASDLATTLNGEATAAAVIDGQVRFEHPRGGEAVAMISQHFRGRFRSISVRRPSLEDVFVHLTGDAFDASESGAR